MNKPNDWQPKDKIELENNALFAVKSNCNTLITAGPGAGKTELLAQRACFLFETNLCINPKRILAISFKRDAANNLKERVIKRCGKQYSGRFDSLTYDAFFKSILDRFYKALPSNFVLKKNYIIKGFDFRGIEARSLIDNCSNDVYTYNTLQGIPEGSLERKILCGSKLSIQLDSKLENYVRKSVWKELIEKNRLTFSMISRLVELILDKNPYILKCLNTTYSHVFLDEFQDTTDIQYDLLKTLFEDTMTIITAVGDDKQTIMRWAGAKENIFSIFENDFSAQRLNLFFNHRSNPELIEIQKKIASLITTGEYDIKTEKEKTGKEVCKFYVFDNENNEAFYLATLITGFIKSENISPRDICLLVRQRSQSYADLIIPQFNKLGLKTRVEDDFQQLLCEPVTQLVLSYLKLSILKRNRDAWEIIRYYYEIISDYEKNGDDIISGGIEKIREFIGTNTDISCIINFVIEILDYSALCSVYKAYEQESEFNRIKTELINHLQESYAKTKNYEKMIEDFEGATSIPIMTIHKSKGLEFHTVILVGLEDSAFWNYPKNQTEENCTLFVAFSRAKENVIYTFSKQRKDNLGRERKQEIRNLMPYIKILNEAGVKVYDIK